MERTMLKAFRESDEMMCEYLEETYCATHKCSKPAMCFTLQEVFKNGVSFRTGTEGPAHDPYSYGEYTFSLGLRLILRIHQGLGEWLEVIEYDGEGGKYSTRFRGDEMVKKFEEVTGWDITKFVDFIEELDKESSEFESCPKCGSESIEWTEGFPGESVLMCQSCKEVLDSRFCEEQIM